ncbi:MAG: hypothetical protein ACLP9L_07735 [Thermoguttaceae bacterium]
MLLKVSAGGVPAGSYLAPFMGVETTTNEYGDGLRWWFEIPSGPHAGSKVGRITSPKPTPKNACGKMLAGITGRSLTAGLEIDLAAYVGKPFLIIVAESKSGNGGTYVDAVTQPPTLPPQSPPSASPLSPTPST